MMRIVVIFYKIDFCVLFYRDLVLEDSGRLKNKNEMEIARQIFLFELQIISD